MQSHLHGSLFLGVLVGLLVGRQALAAIEANWLCCSLLVLFEASAHCSCTCTE
jgi:hypothetical protein